MPMASGSPGTASCPNPPPTPKPSSHHNRANSASTKASSTPPSPSAPSKAANNLFHATTLAKRLGLTPLTYKFSRRAYSLSFQRFYALDEDNARKLRAAGAPPERVRIVGNLVGRAQRATASSERLHELLDATDELQVPDHPARLVTPADGSRPAAEITFESVSAGGADLADFGKIITDKKIAIGVIDHHSLQVERPEEIAEHIRRALKHIPAERLVISSDCGMGREGMSRRHAYYKIVSLVLGTNIVRKELGLPLAQCLAADERYSLVVPPK